MRTLSDGTQVPERTYYYLLDWNDEDGKKFMTQEFGKQRLCDLDRVQYKRLLNKATISDINSL